MNKKDIDNLRGRIKKCIKDAHVHVTPDHGIHTFCHIPLVQKEVVAFLEQKSKEILAVYDEMDIWSMIYRETAPFLNYDKLRKKISNNADQKFFIFVAKLPDLLDESKITEIANNVIKELVNPTKSYALVRLPNVEPGENIRINNDLFLIANLPEDIISNEDYFRIEDDKISDFNFPLENKKAYFLIEQAGWNWRIWSSEQPPLVYKNILQKLKTFLGLSLIKDILKTTDVPVNKSKEKRNIMPHTIGIFSSVEWYEGMPEDWDNPIPEDHPDFNDIRDTYSQGDELLEFCFQKRFFIEDRIDLSQVYADLLNSLTITEYPTKPSFDLKKGKIVELFSDSEKLESPGQFLRKKFDKVRIILNSNDDYAERIKAASLWYLEGYCSESDTFKFIDYTIAVESLLGPKDEKKDKKEKHKEDIPLTQTLCDRCGFSLGKSLKEKEEIRKQFKDIYGIRSRIVHSGKVILNQDDNEHLSRLKDMTKQLISNAIETYSPECNDYPLEV